MFWSGEISGGMSKSVVAKESENRLLTFHCVLDVENVGNIAKIPALNAPWCKIKNV